MKTINQIVFFIFLINSFTVNAQERINKNGRIIARFFDLDNVTIQNVNSNQTVLTEKGGYFKIPITLNDTLVFTSENFKKAVYVIKMSDLRSRFLYVSLDPGENTLEELVIDRTKEQIDLYEAKAKYRGLYKDLYTATSGGPISKLINLLSGRTNMIKKAIMMQEENDLADKMINSMSEEYFTEELKIPKINIGGFGYFLLDDPDVVRAVKTRNTFQLQFLLPFKAEKFLETLKEYQQ